MAMTLDEARTELAAVNAALLRYAQTGNVTGYTVNGQTVTRASPELLYRRQAELMLFIQRGESGQLLVARFPRID